jgi:hypothetical protein
VTGGADITVTRQGALKHRQPDHARDRRRFGSATTAWLPPCSRTCQISTLNLMGQPAGIFMSEGEQGHREFATPCLRLLAQSLPKRNQMTATLREWWRYGQRQRVHYRSSAATSSWLASAAAPTRERDGCVYRRVFKSVAHPERPPMDSELGFFFGAYIAEGHAVKRISRAAHASVTSRYHRLTTLWPAGRILRLIRGWGWLPLCWRATVRKTAVTTWPR